MNYDCYDLWFYMLTVVGLRMSSPCGCNSSATDALCSVKMFVVCPKSVEETQSLYLWMCVWILRRHSDCVDLSIFSNGLIFGGDFVRSRMFYPLTVCVTFPLFLLSLLSSYSFAVTLDNWCYKWPCLAATLPQACTIGVQKAGQGSAG